MEEFETVVVESHPAFIGKICVEFGRMLKGRLEIAIGLETIHPELVEKLNKKMSPELFSEKVSFLVENGISARAFILLRPPFLSEKEGVHWAKKSIDFAFDSGVECCTVIPVRPGNGTMDELLRLGYFTPPKVNSLEKVLEYGIKLNRGRVFADTWDLKMFSECDLCLDKRTARITEINLSQEIRPLIHCNCRS
jgi:radical SAM enzyme (TIGR01210 family)